MTSKGYIAFLTANSATPLNITWNTQVCRSIKHLPTKPPWEWHLQILRVGHTSNYEERKKKKKTNHQKKTPTTQIIVLCEVLLRKFVTVVTETASWGGLSNSTWQKSLWAASLWEAKSMLLWVNTYCAQVRNQNSQSSQRKLETFGMQKSTHYAFSV